MPTCQNFHKGRRKECGSLTSGFNAASNEGIGSESGIGESVGFRIVGGARAYLHAGQDGATT